MKLGMAMGAMLAISSRAISSGGSSRLPGIRLPGQLGGVVHLVEEAGHQRGDRGFLGLRLGDQVQGAGRGEEVADVEPLAGFGEHRGGQRRVAEEGQGLVVQQPDGGDGSLGRGLAAGPARWPTGSCPARSRMVSASSAVPISQRPTRRMSPPARSAAISAARKNSDACWAQKSSCSVPFTEMAPVNASARRAATSGSRQPATGDQAKVEGRSETACGLNTAIGPALGAEAAGQLVDVAFDRGRDRRAAKPQHQVGEHAGLPGPRRRGDGDALLDRHPQPSP